MLQTSSNYCLEVVVLIAQGHGQKGVAVSRETNEKDKGKPRWRALKIRFRKGAYAGYAGDLLVETETSSYGYFDKARVQARTRPGFASAREARWKKLKWLELAMSP
ncbi:hypothetical protein SASPL_100770 [Salvia splendens]|uniref:Uncharacterized protein n=1 Tax=Salvia splendens TaxID=180675 RepID=A0A8X8YPQ0_SALSN|nr:hypothetical protein SASPL_100770 [Salvia splendens]